MMNLLPRGAVLLTAIVCSSLVGCGPGPQSTIDETGRVEMLVTDLSDLARDPERMKEMFVAGGVPPPALAQQFRNLILRPKKTTIKGTEATILVQVDDSQGKTLGEVEWTAVKEGDTWKLQKAVLP